MTDASTEFLPPIPTPIRTRKTWDLILTIVLLVTDALLAFVLAYAAIFLVFASDSCSTQCNIDLMTFGIGFAFVAPFVILIATVVLSIVLLVKRRLAFWVAIVGAVLEIGALVAGGAVVFSSTGS